MAEARIPGASKENAVFDEVEMFSKLAASFKDIEPDQDPEEWLLKDKEYFDLLYKYELTPELNKKLEECVVILLEEIVANFTPTYVNIGKVYQLMCMLIRIPMTKEMLLNNPQLIEILDLLQNADSDYVNNSNDIGEKLIFKSLELKVRMAARNLLAKYADVFETKVFEFKSVYIKMQTAKKRTEGNKK